MTVDPYATGVLDPEVHHRLVLDIERHAADAGITPEWICSPLASYCGSEETAWVKDFRRHRQERRSGLLYVGREPCPEIEDRMAAIAGALIRNFINARVMTLFQFLDAARDGEIPETSCLLVPNFFVDQNSSLPGWRIAGLLDALLHRRSLGLQTVLYAADLKAMGKAYGPALRRHVDAHYQQIKV